MNILQVESATNFSGGVNQTILNSLELKKRGHRIFISCVKDSPIHKELKNYDFEFVFIDENRVFYSSKIIRNFLDKNSIDIVHTNHSRGHSIGLLSLMGRKKEKLVVQRSVVFPAKNIFKYLNPRVNLFVANSNAVRDVLIKHFVSYKKIKVVYSAINAKYGDDTRREQIRKEYGFSDKFVFGVVGNYSPYKGHDIALSAFARIKNRENAKIVLVGKDTERLKGDAVKLGVEKEVVILGFRKDARKIIKGFNCLIIPSLMESFPNVAVEAFFSKTPVLGTEVGGIPELLEEGRGFLCKPNVESMINALIMVYNDPDMKQITDRAFEFAIDNLTIEKKIDKLEAVYGELLSI